MRWRRFSGTKLEISHQVQMSMQFMGSNVGDALKAAMALAHHALMHRRRAKIDLSGFRCGIIVVLPVDS